MSNESTNYGEGFVDPTPFDETGWPAPKDRTPPPFGEQSDEMALQDGIFGAPRNTKKPSSSASVVEKTSDGLDIVQLPLVPVGIGLVTGIAAWLLLSDATTTYRIVCVLLAMATAGIVAHVNKVVGGGVAAVLVALCGLSTVGPMPLLVGILVVGACCAGGLLRAQD